MRIHRLLAEASAGLLREVFDQGEVLDRVVGQAFRKNPRWGKRDRNFVAESVWDVVRWRRALAYVCDSDEAGAMLVATWRRKGFEIPEWWDWRGASLDAMAEREMELANQPRRVRESIPDWMDGLGAEELGPRWDEVLSALNKRAPVFVRANTLQISGDVLLELLTADGVEAAVVPGLPDAIQIAGILPKKWAVDGRLEIQDGGSQMIAPMVQVEPGMKVVDACAGGGGKTLHLAALMEGKGEVLALDVNARKLKQLSERAKRAGVRNVRVAKWDSSTLRKYSGWADRVLIDAPCSGLGTLRRQPDLKWRLDEAGFAKVKRTQRKLLDHYPELLREGGSFVYATCSVMPSENRGQIDNLLHRDPRWALIEEAGVDPATTDFDGFYMARCGAA
ncbi:RsmB/NOP family class I SAM-dependent RNA methyltransferase [Haloferula rosea]|uniref:RsmB/NOP family class I SAM-dependent RNA methyltransferase n=1 Tax=Haloferula rosea TaxID=490093 RepID=A0A934RIB5_9BACT|nr:RsmB/NOP family class I SAM-dependent RNA methyltransferase [Haloferula rosea]MBK1828810.1 RsmB/NOP family class I SAM-dependent RNA methyltransferase [Haloferula rosea]